MADPIPRHFADVLARIALAIARRSAKQPRDYGVMVGLGDRIVTICVEGWPGTREELEADVLRRNPTVTWAQAEALPNRAGPDPA